MWLVDDPLSIVPVPNDWAEECLRLHQSVMHALLVIWTKSKHYNSSSRLVPLLQLITDHLIAQTRNFMPGKQRQNIVGTRLFRNMHDVKWCRW